MRFVVRCEAGLVVYAQLPGLKSVKIRTMNNILMRLNDARLADGCAA